MKFKEEPPLATPKAAERKLLEIANAIKAGHVGRLAVDIINTQFRDAGGSYEDMAERSKPLSRTARSHCIRPALT